ncbi:MAG: hypothetical protein WAL40_19285, partial [Rhodoplanes sp.]
DVQADYLVIELKVPKRGQASGSENGTLPNRDACRLEADRIVLRVPWKKRPLKRRREIIVPQGVPNDVRPIRAETRATLVASIARGRRWLDEIVAGKRECRADCRARTGVKRPTECRLFGTVCTPETPIGSCMVSAEGACAAHWTYGRFREDAAASAEQRAAS